MTTTSRVPDPTALNRVHALVEKVYAVPSGSGAFTRAGMSPAELARLYELVRDNNVRSALEIGMGHGTSSTVLCDALQERGGRLTSIDPFQTAPPPDGFGGVGVEAVRSLGYGGQHQLVERPDYLALPALVEQGAKFDFVLIDGYHSFDYTFLDLFYADLLLADGGILAVHDTTSPPVYRAVRFLETHKPYERLSAPLVVELQSLTKRVARRLRTLASGPAVVEAVRSRQRDWMMLSAHRKTASRQVPEYISHPF